MLKWLVSSLTRRECNVIAVRNDKKKHRDVYAAGARECLVRAVTCRSRMHAESARKCLQRPANRAFFFSSAISQRRATNVSSVRSDDAMGTARGVPVHPAKALNRKNFNG